MLWLLLLALAQPGECNDRKPGLSKCVEYRPEVVDAGKVTRWSCKAACYVRKSGKGWDDGGTDASIVNATGPTQDACRADLERQAANGCRP